MRLTRSRFTVRRLMVLVGICAVILGIAPICFKTCHQYWWTWSVVGDVARGQSARYSPEGFSRAGPRAIQALRAAVRSAPIKTRLAAIQSLGGIALDPTAATHDLAKPAIPDLIAVLGDKDDGVRVWATLVLGQFGPDAASGVEPLLALLRNEKNPQVITSAVQSLGEIGPVARSALPALFTIVQDRGHFAQVMAIQSYWRIGPKGQAEASIVVPELIDHLVRSKEPRTRVIVAEILREIGPAANEAIPALSQATGDLDPSVRRAAQNALRVITNSQVNP